MAVCATCGVLHVERRADSGTPTGVGEHLAEPAAHRRLLRLSAKLDRMSEDRIERERDHWDHVIGTVDEIVDEFHAGPDPNTARMLDAARPGPGRRILDLACGGGVTSAWLAAMGADVTGIDLSPASVRVARAVAERLGLQVRFVVADLEQHGFVEEAYDAIVGRYALHHLDVGELAPALANSVKPGGTAAFVETMATNPFLRLARTHLTGRYGVPRYGTVDEHPLVAEDINALRDAFGRVDVVTEEFHFLSIFDRQVLHYRSGLATKLLLAGDRLLSRSPVGSRWGYHQVLIAHRVRA